MALSSPKIISCWNITLVHETWNASKSLVLRQPFKGFCFPVFFFWLNKKKLKKGLWRGFIDPSHVMIMSNTTCIMGLNDAIFMCITHSLKRYYSNRSTPVKHVKQYNFLILDFIFLGCAVFVGGTNNNQI